MDDIQHSEYLRVNKYLLFAVSAWPYQTIFQRSLVGIILIPIVTAQLILQFGGMITAIIADDIESLLETFLLGLVTPFGAMPLLLNIGDALGLCNISDDKPLAFRVEYFVDVDKYYYFLLVHSYIGTLGYTVIVLAINSIIIVYVLHECGLCEILRVKLENFVETDAMDIELHPNKFKKDKWYQNARDCVLLHKRIIEFAKILEDANTTSYLLQLGFNMICMSFTQFQAIINIQDTPKVLRYVSITICLLCDLLFLSWTGQQLSNSTERIFEFTTNGRWYQSSINCRKLLTIMLSKSIAPLTLTACKLYTLNLESFTTEVLDSSVERW